VRRYQQLLQFYEKRLHCTHVTTLHPLDEQEDFGRRRLPPSINNGAYPDEREDM
jgi:hypothetical protein